MIRVVIRVVNRGGLNGAGRRAKARCRECVQYYVVDRVGDRTDLDRPGAIWGEKNVLGRPRRRQHGKEGLEVTKGKTETGS